MITPDAGEPAAEQTGGEQVVPLAALEIDGTAPAVGDDVSYTVAGKIARVEGGHAYVTASTINDQPATKPTAPAAEMSDADVMAAAKKADEDDGY
jgi:hypothetical protein